MKKVTILFSRKYKRGEGPSDKNVAPTLKTELETNVFETTFKTALGFKRVLDKIDAKAEDLGWDLSILVVHYSDPSIFNGLVQQTIKRRFFLFYDEKTKLGGLSYASTKGAGARSLYKLYEFKTLGVDELFFGSTLPHGDELINDKPVTGSCTKIYYRAKYYRPEMPKPFPLARPWHLIAVDDRSQLLVPATAYKAIYLGEKDRCQHYRTFAESFEFLELDEFEPLFCRALKYRAHPFVEYKVWPILGTQLVVVSDDAHAWWPDGNVSVVYLGRKRPRSVNKLKRTLNEIILDAVSSKTP